MLYVNINDICITFKIFAERFLMPYEKRGNSLAHIINVYYPEPITIIDLAKIVRDTIAKYSNGRIIPKIKVINTGQPSIFNEEDKKLIRVDVSKALNFLV